MCRQPNWLWQRTDVLQHKVGSYSRLFENCDRRKPFCLYTFELPKDEAFQSETPREQNEGDDELKEVIWCGIRCSTLSDTVAFMLERVEDFARPFDELLT